MNSDVLFSSGKDDWETPHGLYNELDEEFRFGLDVAANAANAKCLRWCGPGHVLPTLHDGLQVNWRFVGGGKTCWMNPPYSRGLQGKFITKASAERLKGVTTVALLPARTDTVAFHTYIYQQPNVEIRFLKGRIKFVGAEHGAPFPSMVVVFRGEGNG